MSHLRRRRPPQPGDMAEGCAPSVHGPAPGAGPRLFARQRLFRHRRQATLLERSLPPRAFRRPSGLSDAARWQWRGRFHRPLRTIAARTAAAAMLLFDRTHARTGATGASTGRDRTGRHPEPEPSSRRRSGRGFRSCPPHVRPSHAPGVRPSLTGPAARGLSPPRCCRAVLLVASLVLGFAGESPAQGDHAGDRAALVALYNATDGSQWW